MLDPIDVIREYSSKAKRVFRVKCPVTITVGKLYAPSAFSRENRVFMLGDWWMLARRFEEEEHIPFAILVSGSFHEMYHVYEWYYGYRRDEDRATRIGFRAAIKAVKQKYGIDIDERDVEHFHNLTEEAHEQEHKEKFYETAVLIVDFAKIGLPILIMEYVKLDPDLSKTLTTISLAGEG